MRYMRGVYLEEIGQRGLVQHPLFFLTLVVFLLGLLRHNFGLGVATLLFASLLARKLDSVMCLVLHAERSGVNLNDGILYKSLGPEQLGVGSWPSQFELPFLVWLGTTSTSFPALMP